MGSSDADRIAAFTNRFARAQASRVIDLPWGFAHLQSAVPDSHAHNGVVVTSGVSADEVLSTTEQIMGSAGLEHRRISVINDQVGADLSAELISAGYEHDTLITMIDRSEHSRTSEHPVEPEHPVMTVSFEEIRPAVVRDWANDLPDASADVIAQLADRMQFYPRAADITHLAVFEGDEIAVRAELYVDTPNRIGQLESVYAHASFRGRGYARSLLLDAQRRLREADIDLSFLVADLNDWPREWYARLGWVASHRMHDFSMHESHVHESHRATDPLA